MPILLEFSEPKRPVLPLNNPVHKIRNQLCVIQLAIQVNAPPEITIRAIREIVDILGPLESILKEREVRH